MDGPLIIAFATACLLLAMSPGPGTALFIRDVTRGRWLGTVAGLEAGILIWAVASALGVAALVAASEVAYLVLRVVGACVLVFLGLQTLWYARRGAAVKPRPLLNITGFRGALLTNTANPKAAVFAFSFYPQFIPADAPVLGWTLGLVALQLVIDGGWYLILGLALSRVRRFLEAGRVRRWIDRVVGSVLVALGLRVALTSR